MSVVKGYLTTLTGKNVIHYKNSLKESLAASDLPHMFTQSITFYTFHRYILNGVQMLEKSDLQDRQKTNRCSIQQVLRGSVS